MATKILVADDDELIAQLVRASLEGDGVEALHAADGETALRLANDERPAIILLDVMMPGLDGFEVLRRLREGEQTRDTPVIMLTARQYQEDVIKAKTLGVHGYLVKPFTPEALAARLKRILEAAAKS